VRSLLRSSQPAVRALHTRRGALALRSPRAAIGWSLAPSGAIVSVIVITKVLGRGTERAVGRKVCERLRQSEMWFPLCWLKVRRAASLASQNVT
jgi:hypothetical protein